MKTAAHFVIGLILLGKFSQAQDQEWKTYYGEVVGFQINYPDGWNMGASDKNKKGSALVVYAPGQIAGMVVLIQKSMYTLSKDMNGWVNITKKDAKRDKDDYFKVLGEGAAKTSSGEKALWIEYTKTSTLDDGTKSKQTHKDYRLTTKKGLAMSGDLFTIEFYSRSEDWEANSKIFEKMFQSLKFTGKK